MALPREYTEISRNEIASSGIGVSPRGIASYEDLQRAAFSEGPAASAAAQDSADQAAIDAGVADAKAVDAGVAAEGAQGTADAAMMRADDAYVRGDEAYELAETKVTKDLGPVFAAPLAAPSRAPLPTYAGGTAGSVYTAADVQSLMDQVVALTSRVAALTIDLRSNHSLTN